MSDTDTITADPTATDVESTTVPDAPTDTTTPPAQDEDTAEPARRSRGMLEMDVKAVTDLYVQGKLTLPEGATALTPHFIGLAIKETETTAPSTGAIAAVLNRWEECGYIEVSEKPRGFVNYTEAARTDGLAALKERLRASKKETRTAARAAEDAAAAPAVAATNAA